MLSKTTKKQKNLADKTAPFIISRSGSAQQTKNPRVILPYKTAFIVRHIRFIETYRLELYIELSIQSLLEFTGVTQ